MRPQLQATGELQGGQSGWAWPWLFQQLFQSRRKPHSFPPPCLWPGCPAPGMPSRLWNWALAPGALHNEGGRVHQSSYDGGGRRPQGTTPRQGGKFRSPVPPPKPYSERAPERQWARGKPRQRETRAGIRADGAGREEASLRGCGGRERWRAASWPPRCAQHRSHLLSGPAVGPTVGAPSLRLYRAVAGASGLAPDVARGGAGRKRCPAHPFAPPSARPRPPLGSARATRPDGVGAEDVVSANGRAGGVRRRQWEQVTAREGSGQGRGLAARGIPPESRKGPDAGGARGRRAPPKKGEEGGRVKNRETRGKRGRQRVEEKNKPTCAVLDRPLPPSPTQFTLLGHKNLGRN